MTMYEAHFWSAGDGGSGGSGDVGGGEKRSEVGRWERRPVVRWGEDGHPWVVDRQRRRLVRADSDPAFAGVWHSGEKPTVAEVASNAGWMAAAQGAPVPRRLPNSPGWGGLRG